MRQCSPAPSPRLGAARQLQPRGDPGPGAPCSPPTKSRSGVAGSMSPWPAKARRVWMRPSGSAPDASAFHITVTVSWPATSRCARFSPATQVAHPPRSGSRPAKTAARSSRTEASASTSPTPMLSRWWRSRPFRRWESTSRHCGSPSRGRTWRRRCSRFRRGGAASFRMATPSCATGLGRRPISRREGVGWPSRPPASIWWRLRLAAGGSRGMGASRSSTWTAAPRSPQPWPRGRVAWWCASSTTFPKHPAPGRG